MFKTVSQMVHDNVFLQVKGLPLNNVFLKIESFNPAGSVKMKTALGLLHSFESENRIKPDSVLIESSSGNLGVALSLLCAERGYRFVCVVDPNTSQQNVKTMRAYGAEVVTVSRRDSNGGYLGTRIAYVQDALNSDERFIWLNQYSNPENPKAHARTTALSIAKSFDHVDYLFVGAGTTGTLMGCVQYFRQHRPATKIVAVDSVGSVTFGYPAGKRFIPGLGSSQRPPIFEDTGIHERIMIPEADTVSACRRLARTNGILVGGSTGTVIAAVESVAQSIPPDAIVIAISPDSGDRYLDTVYDDEWVRHRFPSALPAAVCRDTLKHQDSPSGHGQAGEAPSFAVVPGRTVKEILDRDLVSCIHDVRMTYLAHHAGETVNPDSYFLRFPNSPRNRIIALPASIDSGVRATGIKWIASYPKNTAKGLPRASATLILNDPESGFPYACLEASYISAVRTAASAVLAATHLNDRRKSAPAIGFIGAGVIARAIANVFHADSWSFNHAGVFDLDETSRKSLVAHLASKGQVAHECANATEALGADIVVLATNASEPHITEPDSFRPGQIILNISLRDVGADLILKSANVVDDVEHCLKADTSPHLAEKKFGHRDFISGTLAQLLSGDLLLDRKRPLIFSPFGLGVLDVALGARVLAAAQAEGAAVPIPDFFAETTRW
ncbi:2,3-diaminopropionate biosynthesis protein SbnA [Paraburkholderia fungorum]|uniref:2,3-diaminopropionate biosynthesis protein SbnA n=1 Tax=Paraburkholderia fungorum TaxID=134537 RepID=UPI0009DCD811|nr:2,3-diaminopropionate biosynthesis protein SbnA [Paraburkholderia fungorum]PNE59686.1 2,3-diaminopropionate biosynthesis protein SbnA [Paraburkholderia fungorum]